MRSASEIRFRLRQETSNLHFWLRPPKPDVSAVAISSLLPPSSPVAGRLRHSEYAADVERLARGVLSNRIPLLDQELSFQGPIPWRRDWRHEREFPGLPYFRLVPYLDAERVGDHKFIWELNRHQHLVLLAQAHLITGRTEFFDTLIAHWEDWLRENPFQRGINWTSALEVAFRALSWIWVFHLVGDRMDASLRQRFLVELYRHGLHIEFNLSVYFSPNTHLLGEAVALHALGVLFPQFPRSHGWRDTGSRIVGEERDRQVNPDGSHFEQSTYYHVYALDFFLLHYLLAGRPDDFSPTLIRMAEYLDAIQGPERRIPFIGDDDGGRLFHPYGDRDRFGRATLATCAALFNRPQWLNAPSDLHSQAAWWIGPSALALTAIERPPHPSRLFRDAGTAVFEEPAPGGHSLFAIVDAGGFGALRAGHSHSDTLSIIVRRNGHDLLIDPGTYSYCDPNWRARFRGSAAHNTIRIDECDQSPAHGPFAWSAKPEVVIQTWQSTLELDYLDAVCKYAGRLFKHRRRVLFLKDRGWILIVDEVQGPRLELGEGEHSVEQSWHLGSPVSIVGDHVFELGAPAVARLVLDEGMVCAVVENWRSPAYGVKLRADAIVARAKPALPLMIAAAIVDSSCSARSVKAEQDGSGTVVILGDSRLRFPS